MPNPYGNPGNKGGGRPSAYQERANADILVELWENGIDKDELKKRLASSKHSLKDVFIAKALQGNEKVLIAIFQKIYPDKVDLGGSFLVNIVNYAGDTNTTPVQSSDETVATGSSTESSEVQVTRFTPEKR